MKWRPLLFVSLGLLLPIPLLWLSYISMPGHGAHLPLSHQDKVLVPMLSPEERLRLHTYEQDCQTDADCEPRLRCFYNMRTERQYCTDSTCMTNEDCPKDFACRTLRADNGKELLRICSLEGLRKEGELCEELPAKLEDGCEKGLICYGFCGRSCRLDEPSSCPEGFVCKEGDNGPSCLPTCEGRSCPEGQRCITSLLGGMGSVCMKVYGQDCELNPCPQGLECDLNTAAMTPGKIWMECLSACAGNEPRCPEGTVCSFYQCRKACDPQGPRVCAPGFACRRKHPNQPWACLPSPRSE
jgi:hypothetical protein